MKATIILVTLLIALIQSRIPPKPDLNLQMAEHRVNIERLQAGVEGYKMKGKFSNMLATQDRLLLEKQKIEQTSQELAMKGKLTRNTGIGLLVGTGIFAAVAGAILAGKLYLPNAASPAPVSTPQPSQP